jgi:hypothetical protein
MKFSERLDERNDAIRLAANRIFNDRPEVWRRINEELYLLRVIAADLRIVEVSVAKALGK